MSSSLLRTLLLSGSLAVCALSLSAQEILPTTGIDLPPAGKVAPRHAKDVVSSWWSIGGETIDRDFTVYEHYKRYLGPLGAKSIRIQGGWAKCERQPGVYSWEWLDAIIDDALSQGVRPWVEFNYGNPVYPGGGDTGLGGGFPSSPEALAAWDRWVRALVTRYKDRVNEWEVWNEPDINNRGTAPVDAYIDLYLRTAAIVREVQPDSRLYALALAHSAEYAEQFLAGMKDLGRLDLIDAITIHGYPRNPDDTALVDRLRAYLGLIGKPIQIRQGETGATSRYQENFALREISWTENLQAKWNLRRMLAHRAKEVPFNLFTISDMHYTQGNNTSGDPDGILRMNYKGMLATNPDQTIAYVKPAYYAAQSVFAIFDDALVRRALYPYSSTSLRGLTLSGYEKRPGGGQVIAYWFNDAPPAEANGVTLIDLTLPKGSFSEPVVVDLRTGAVYLVPADRWSRTETGVKFKGLPAYDSPMLLAERDSIGVAGAGR
jgi:hypothetical protein